MKFWRGAYIYLGKKSMVYRFLKEYGSVSLNWLYSKINDAIIDTVYFGHN